MISLPITSHDSLSRLKDMDQKQVIFERTGSRKLNRDQKRKENRKDAKRRTESRNDGDELQVTSGRGKGMPACEEPRHVTAPARGHLS